MNEILPLGLRALLLFPVVLGAWALLRRRYPSLAMGVLLAFFAAIPIGFGLSYLMPERPRYLQDISVFQYFNSRVSELVFGADIPSQQPQSAGNFSQRFELIILHDLPVVIYSLTVLCAITLTVVRQWKAFKAMNGGNQDTKYGVQYVVSKNAVQPLTMWWGRSRIFVPADFHEWAESEQEMTLTHEDSHRKRGDAAWYFWAKIATRPIWFVPIGFLLKRLKMTAEALADQEVMGRGFDPLSYSELLLAKATDKRLSEGLLPMAKRKSLAGRIKNVIEGRYRKTPWPITLAVSVAFCAWASHVFADELRVEPLESPEDVAGLYHIEQTFDIFQDYALTVSESSDWRFSAGDTEMKLMGQLSTSLVDDNDLAEWMLVYGNVEESKKFPTESGRFVSAEAILWCDRLIEEPALADARFNELINAHYQVYRYQEESRHPRTLLKDLTDSQKERIQTIYREGLLKSEKMDDCALSWDDNRQEFGDLVRTDFLYRYSEDWHVVYLHKHVIKYEEIFNFFEGIQEFEYGSGKIVFAVGRQMDRRFYPDTSFGLDPVAFEELLQRSLSFGEPSRSLSNTVFQIENHFDEVIELRVHADWFDVSSHYSELSADSAYNFNNAASIDYLRPYYWKKLALYSSRDDAWEYVDDAWESGEGQLFDDVQLTLSAVRVLQVQESEDLPRLTEQQFIDHFRPFIADAARSLYQ